MIFKRNGNSRRRGIEPRRELSPRFARLLRESWWLLFVAGFLYLALQDRDDFAALWFPLLYVGTNCAYLLLAVPLGRLADRIGRARVLVGGHVVLITAYLSVLLPLTGPAGTVLTLTLLGVFYAATDGVLPALISRLVPDNARATGIAAAQTVTAAARFGSPSRPSIAAARSVATSSNALWPALVSMPPSGTYRFCGVVHIWPLYSDSENARLRSIPW